MKKSQRSWKHIAANLREFRTNLALSQHTFGVTFGGYTRRQINAYESGESAIPVDLLLEIRDKGYPIEAVIGSQDEAPMVSQVIGYALRDLKTHTMLRQLMKRVVRTLDEEEKFLGDIIRRVTQRSDRPPIRRE
jgi:hypothetical protein